MTSPTEYGSGIFPQHQQKLSASAVTPEVAADRGYVSADTKAQLQRYGFGPAQRLPPALVIPLWGVSGEVAGYQLRPDDPRALNGKVAKYETRAGQKMLLDVPPRVRPHLDDPSRPLLVTEGPIKADAAVSAGLDCVALLGVWSWRGSSENGGKVALPDFEYVALNGRRVYVAFDSDVMLKEQVHGALARLGDFLSHRGAQVAYLHLPHGDAGAKVGLDDYLAAGHSTDELLALATTELRRPASDEGADAEPVETFDDVPDESGWQVLDDLAQFFERFVVFANNHQRDVITLWVAHTHVIDALDFTPRLALLSPVKQCAKSRLFELMVRVARRARHTVSMSAAYMFRTIETTTPTLLVDEVDTVFGSKTKNDANDDLRGLINAGFERGATVGRMVGEGAGLQPKDFPVFCAVALAGIGNCLPDTVLDRSLVIRMRRRAPGERIEPFRRRRAGTQAEKLRRRLGAWSETAAFTVEAAIDAGVALPEGIEDRPADCWEPLVAVADAAGGDWPQRARDACVELNATRAESDPAIGVRLLADIRSLFADADVDRMFSALLVERLNGLEEAPWGGWRKGNGIQARDLARILGDFDVASKNIRAGEKQKKGYEIADFAEAFERYLPHTTSPTPGEKKGGLMTGTPTPPGRSVPTSQNGDGPENTPSDQHRDDRDGGTDESGVGDMGRTRGQSHDWERHEF